MLKLTVVDVQHVSCSGSTGVLCDLAAVGSWIVCCVMASMAVVICCLLNHSCSHAKHPAIYNRNCALRCYLISDGDGYVHSCNLEIGWGSLSGSTILLGLVVCNIFKCTVVAF